MRRRKPQVSVLNHLPHKIRKAIILIRDLLIKKYHPDMLILFGSYADRIAWHRQSDIDMLIVTETDDRPRLELEIKEYIKVAKFIATLLNGVKILHILFTHNSTRHKT